MENLIFLGVPILKHITVILVKIHACVSICLEILKVFLKKPQVVGHKCLCKLYLNPDPSFRPFVEKYYFKKSKFNNFNSNILAVSCSWTHPSSIEIILYILAE